MTAPTGLVTELSHDLRGRLRTHSETAPGSAPRVTRYEYDQSGSLVQVITPDGATTVLTPNAAGDTAAVEDAAGNRQLLGYDESGNLETVEIVYPAGTVVSALTHTYDSRDRRISGAIGGSVSEWRYDDLGRVVNATDPRGGDTRQSYDARGITVSYRYDALNRLVLIDYPTDPDVVFEYDEGLSGSNPNARGRLTRIERAGSLIANDYDAFGNVVRDARTIAGNTFVTAYGYDAAGRLERITYPSGTVLWYRYDTAGRIHRVDLDTGSGPGAFLDSIAYRPFGAMTAATGGNGFSLVRGYDERGLPVNIGVHPPLSAPALLDRDYAVDATGNIEAIDDFVEPLSSEDFRDGYDTLDRLVAADGPYGMRSYEHDRVGNRKRMRYESSLPEFAPKPALADLTFEYDGQGRIARALSGGGIVGEYQYNVLGQREHKSASGRGTAFVYGLSGELLAEANDAGTVEREYLYLNGRLVGVVDAGATPSVYWVHTDHLGTPRMITDAAGAVVWETVQAPFGAVLATTEIVGLNLRFPGQYFDAETGAYYNYHR